MGQTTNTESTGFGVNGRKSGVNGRLEVLYGCGLRASEASTLDVSRCHLDEADDPYVVVTGKGNKVRAAKALGVSRRALYRLISKHGLQHASDAPRT